jgi:hypothetical protein
MNTAFWNQPSWKLSPQDVKYRRRKEKAVQRERQNREALDNERISAHDRAVRVARFADEL